MGRGLLEGVVEVVQVVQVAEVAEVKRERGLPRRRLVFVTGCRWGGRDGATG